MDNIHKIDIFSQSIDFTLNNRSKIQTILGGFFTVIFFSIGIFIFIENGKEIFIKKSPISFVETSLSENPLNITINNEKFPIYFQLVDLIGNTPNLTNKLDIYLNQFTVTSEGLGTTANSFISNLEYKISDPNKKEAVFIMSQNESVTLSGSWSNNNINFIQFVVSLCNNITNKTCETKDQIFDFIGKNQLNFNFLYPERNLQLDNANEPVITQIVNNYVFITKETKYMSYYLRENEILTDMGVIFSDVNKLDYISVDYFFTDNSILPDSDLNLFVGSFFTTNKTQRIHRNYLTIQAVLSQVGGLLNIVYWLFLYINSYFTRIKKNLTIMNSIFENMRDDSEFNPKIIRKNSKLISGHSFPTKGLSVNKTIKFRNHNSINNQSSVNQIENDGLKIQKIDFGKMLFETKIFQKKINNIEVNLTFKDLIINLCCCSFSAEKSIDLKYYNLLSKIIDYYCDFIHYIQKLEEIEKLKKIILDESQLKVFNLIKCKIRDIDIEKIVENENEMIQLIRNIFEKPKNRIEESIKSLFIQDDNFIKWKV